MPKVAGNLPLSCMQSAQALAAQLSPRYQALAWKDSLLQRRLGRLRVPVAGIDKTSSDASYHQRSSSVSFDTVHYSTAKDHQKV